MFEWWGQYSRIFCLAPYIVVAVLVVMSRTRPESVGVDEIIPVRRPCVSCCRSRMPVDMAHHNVVVPECQEMLCRPSAGCCGWREPAGRAQQQRSSYFLYICIVGTIIIILSVFKFSPRLASSFRLVVGRILLGISLIMPINRLNESVSWSNQ